MFPPNRSFIILILIIVLLAACGGKQETAEVTPTTTPVAIGASIPATEDAFTVSLSEITGGVLAREAQEPSFSEAKNGYNVQLLGQVQTQSDGRARLDFSTGSLVRLGPNTLFTLQPPEADSQGVLIRIRLELGRLWVVLQGGSLEVETKSGVAAVRGSYMSVSYEPDSGEARITCLEGNCSLSTPEGSVQITAGQTAVVTGAGQPPQVGDMNDQDVQEWLNNNPEATLVVPDLTETPVGAETLVATNEPPTEVIPLPPVIANPPVPTEKVSPPEEPQPTATRTVPPALTSTGTVTATQTASPTMTPTVTSTGTATETLTVPALFTPFVEILSVSSAPALGQMLDVYVKVSPDSGGPIPTGRVRVLANGTTLCSIPLDSTGVVMCSGPLALAGNINLEAHYSGDSQYYSGFSLPTMIIISRANTTTTITSVIPNSVTTGSLVTFTATVDNAPFPPEVGPPTGSVTFLVSSGDSCTITFAPWTCDLTFTGTGPGTVTATYSGDTKFEGSSSAAVPLVFFIAIKHPSSQPLILWSCDQGVLEPITPKLFGCGWNVRSVSAGLGE